MKILGALVVAMTVGSGALILMETAPIRPPVTRLSAVSTPTNEFSEAVSSTDDAIKVARWRNVIVRTTADRLDAYRDCHFVVESSGGPDGRCVRPTSVWSRQANASHISAPGRDWSSDSITVCLVGDFSKDGPGQRQFEALVGLVRSLQQTCGITAERVYLAKDIDPRSASPGQAFPARQFNASLIRPRTF